MNTEATTAPTDSTPTTAAGLIEALRLSRPEVAISVEWDADYHHEWNGDGNDPREEGLYAHDVTVSARTIQAGIILEGCGYLGGCYSRDGGHHCPEIHGYFPQMLEEALQELDQALFEEGATIPSPEVTPAPCEGTAGPWEIEGDDQSTIRGERVLREGGKPQPFILAETQGYLEERRANARLIVKAPEMRGLVEDLKAFLLKGEAEHGEMHPESDARDLFDRARSILASL